MKDNSPLEQFAIVQVDLEPTMGFEQQGVRPCVVVQTNGLSSAKTFLVAPLTSQKISRVYPHEVIVQPSKGNALKQVSKIKLDQIRVVDIRRIQKQLGFLDRDYHASVREAILIAFDIHLNFSA